MYSGARINTVYKIDETRSYFMARLSAIGGTILLSGIVTLILARMLGGDFFAVARHSIGNHFFAALVALISRLIGWLFATALLTLSLAIIYYWAPNVRKHCWR